MKDQDFPSFGCWWIDPETGQKVPGISPRNEKKQPAKPPKPAPPAKAKE